MARASSGGSVSSASPTSSSNRSAETRSTIGQYRRPVRLAVVVHRSCPPPANSNADQECSDDDAQRSHDRPNRLTGHERPTYQADPLAEPDDTDHQEESTQGEEDAHRINL